MGLLTLVVGGVRSGKSRFAESLARTHPWGVYLATAQAGDAEMARRIDRHRERRSTWPAGWRTVEEPWDVAGVLAGLTPPEGADPAAGCVLLDCATLWLTNLLVGVAAHPALSDEEVHVQVEALAAAARAAPGRVIVVSNEVGCGIVPVNPLARRFADLQGEANQVLAVAAGAVYACLAGIPVRLK